MICGHVVFSGNATGVLKEYNRNKVECESHILFVKALTTDVAFYILKNSVCGIISEESSFATHGANILRCYYKNSKNEIVWISGVNRSNIMGLFGKKIIIYSNGELNERSDTEYFVYEEPDAKAKIVSYKPLSKRSIVEYNISKKTYEICYWPHRTFDVLTFSIMKEGLKKNLQRLGINEPVIYMEEDASIWFKNAPYISTLCELAKNPDEAIFLLSEQIHIYESIFNRLQKEYLFSDIIDMLIDYFSIFILFHDTYEDVLISADSFFKEELEETVVYQLMNELMSCRLDEWMLKNDLLLEKRKTLLSEEKVVPLPSFSIIEDIDCSIEDFVNRLENLGYKDYWLRYKDRIDFYIKFFVAKEWKFVINKMLFTRFADAIRKKMPAVSFAELSLKTYEEVKILMEKL